MVKGSSRLVAFLAGKKWSTYEVDWGAEDVWMPSQNNEGDVSLCASKSSGDRHLIWLSLKVDSDFWYVMYQKSTDGGVTLV